METKIIKAVFGGGTSTVTNKRTRTDYGQVLEISGVDLPSTFECIFSNSATSAGTGKKMIGSNQRCLIPDEYLQTGQTIYAWILLHDTEDDGRHMYSIRIPVADMPDTSPEEPTPVEQSVISQAITALNSAVTTTSQKAQEATESADRAEQAAEGVEGYAERAESAQQAAENARDRATQAETSARTSAATASEKASEAISSATTASQSAITAESASESAMASATASAESASQASQSADTASAKATEASGYANNANTDAQTASQKALEAAQSASSASQAKTDAITAKQASETAQGLAESARDDAITAKTSAEDARDEARDIVDGITNKMAQIDSNTDRIESLEDDRYKPYATDTASGSIASFSDGADDIPLKSCIVQIEPVQAGSGDPSPDNVRPITGWTGAKVTRTGKNLLNFNSAYYYNDNIFFGGYRQGSNYIVDGTLTLKAGTYTASANANMTAWYLLGETGLINLKYNSNVYTFTLSEEKAICLRCYMANIPTKEDFVQYDIQLELGSTATPYEPYTGQTYPITFPAEAGTVYGGYIDVTGGELVVDRAQIASYNGETLPSTWISDRDKYVAGTTPTIGAQVVYKLAEPIHYPLTPTEIKTLLGQNNVWADTGDVSVEYRADTKLYIEKLTQPEENDMIADSAINSGQFFMIGNSLYRALANIASGATITVGTNAQRVSLSDALNLVNA